MDLNENFNLEENIFFKIKNKKLLNNTILEEKNTTFDADIDNSRLHVGQYIFIYLSFNCDPIEIGNIIKEDEKEDIHQDYIYCVINEFSNQYYEFLLLDLKIF